MASLKRTARNKATGKFAPKQDLPEDLPVGTAEEVKKRVGRPKKKREPERDTFELSITVSVGGADVPVGLLENINSFLVNECLVGKCSLERGGIAYHLHFQMIVRILAVSVISVSRLLKSYLAWDKEKPDGAMVMCKKLANKGLHTFHGMIGYCMKDAEQDHFKSIDHNISAEDITLGLEQLAMHGQEECKMRIMLTQRNFAQKCLQWRRWNYKHPAVLDWEKEFFLMLKTGKYYPCTTWVVGSFGRGYEPHRMQSYWKMLVNPATITLEDVNNVFCQPEHIAFPGASRKEWFEHRWEDIDALETKNTNTKADDASMAEILVSMKTVSQEQKNIINSNSMADILVHTPAKSIISRKGKEKKNASPTRRLWPAEWKIDKVCAGQETTESGSLNEGEEISALAFGEYAPVYKRAKMGIFVS